MPLRDHFRSPAVEEFAPWESFHGTWPTFLAKRLKPVLPPGYFAQPRARLGVSFELDVGGFHKLGPAKSTSGPAVATYRAPAPTQQHDIDLADLPEYEVQVVERVRRGMRLVAAVEFVSPGNKDRADHRRAFLTKCAGLIRQGICVTVVDVVTNRRANLAQRLAKFCGIGVPLFVPPAPRIYAVTFRPGAAGTKPGLAIWSYPLVVGQPLPEPPLFLGPKDAVPLDLDGSYNDTCELLALT